MLGAHGAAAAPSGNSGCVAQYVHGPPGPPGQFQRDAHVTGFGLLIVRSVAQVPGEECTP